jgi:hypothetical protein
MLGDALWNIRASWDEPFERESFRDWWCGEQRSFLKRWPAHEQHLRSLFSYIDDRYLDDRYYKYVTPPPAKMKPCDGLAKG